MKSAPITNCAFGCLLLFGCQNPNQTEEGRLPEADQQSRATMAQRSADLNRRPDPNGYLVLGEVRKPGSVATHGSQKTLLTLLSDTGGLTEYAFVKKIQIITAGVTNIVNYWPVKKGETEDPLIPLGSIVLVKKAPF